MPEAIAGKHELEKQILLGCAGEKILPASTEALPGIVSALDWDWLIGAANVHEILLLLGFRLQSDTAIWPFVPPERRTEFETNAYLAWVEYEEYYSLQVKKLLTALNRGGVKVVLLKGPVLAALYPKEYLRKYGDIDIFIAENDLRKTADILYGLGYQPRKPEAEWPDSASFAYHWPRFSQTGNFDIEIHSPWHHSAGSLGALDTSEWLTGAEKTQLCGVETFVLAKEFNLLYLCAHVHRHHFVLGGPYRLRQLLDVYYLIKKGIDWPLFLSIFQRYYAAQKELYDRIAAAFHQHTRQPAGDWFDWGDLAAHVHYCLSTINEFYEPLVPGEIVEATRPDDRRLLDVGIVLKSLEDERLYLWQAPKRSRYLDCFTASLESLIAEGALKYWQQIPAFTTWSDGSDKAYAELMKTLPRLKP